MTAAASPVFEAVGISKSFAGLHALQDVDLALTHGRVLGIIGPNGAGKSTLINVATGLFRPDRGTVRLQGRDVTRSSMSERARWGLMRSFQHARVFSSMTVRGALRLAAESPRARALEAADARSVDEITEQFGLAQWIDRPTADLPYGAQKVLNLALVAMCSPHALLLDEPFAGVGPDDVERLSNDIRTVRDAGVAIGLVEHNMEALMRLVDEVVVLDSGAVIFRGTPAEARTSEVVRAAYLGTHEVPA